MRCSKCGVDNPEDVPRCLECGALLTSEPPTRLEIEVYDLEHPKTASESPFAKALAAHAEEVKPAPPPPVEEITAAPAVREELEQGIAIRKRRLSYRSPRRRNIIIAVAATGALALAVAAVTKFVFMRMPKYEYAVPAHAEATSRALAAAKMLEEDKVDLLANYDGPVAGLTVTGAAGKIIIDGGYVADAPVNNLRVPPGRRHIIVKNENEIIADETIDFAPGASYQLEVAGAAALSAGIKP